MMRQQCMKAGGQKPTTIPGGSKPPRPYKPSGGRKKLDATGAKNAIDGRNSQSTPSLAIVTPAKVVPNSTGVARILSRRISSFNIRRSRKDLANINPGDVEEDPTKGRCILAPTAPIKMKWDIVMLFLILYNVIMIPVRICFEVEAPSGSLEFWFETFFDMLFLVDIVLNFNSAYIDDEGVLETNRSRIAINYMKGWFLIDCPSSLPTEPVMELIGLAIPSLGIGGTADEVISCAAAGGDDTALMMPKLLRFLRMARFMKLIRLLKAAKIFKVMEEELDINMSVLKLFKLVFIVVFLGHLIACFVFLVNKATQAADIFGMFRLPQFYGCFNTTTEEFVELLPDDWTPSIGNAQPEWPRLDDCECETGGQWQWKIPPGEQYVWVLYWTLTTMTTIGYGDVSPLTRGRTYVEALITVIVEVAGASIFGYMIGNIASVIADFDQFGAVQKQRMEEIKSYLSYKRVPKHLSKQVRKYYGHYYDKRGCEELKQDWSALPNILKAELVKFENKEFVEQFKCFLPVGGYDFVEVLVDRLRPLLVDVGGIVAGAVKQPPAPSPPSCDFFLICTGEVHKLIYQDPLDVPLENGNEEAVPLALVSQESRGSSNASRLVRAMRPGEWFGHVELITAFDDLEEGGSGALQWQHEPRSMYKAKRITELLYLAAGDFFETVRDYDKFRYVLDMQEEFLERFVDSPGDADDETKAAPAPSEASTVAASSSSAGEYGAPAPVSVPEGEVLENQQSFNQQSFRRELHSPRGEEGESSSAATPPAKRGVLVRAASVGKPSAAGNPKSGGPSKAAATKWEAALKAVQSGQVLVPDGARSSQAQLDAQFLRQKIETEVFGLPLRPANQITDSDILALIRERAALPTPLKAPASASASVASSPMRTPRPYDE